MKRKKMHQNWLFWKEGWEDKKKDIVIPHDAMLAETRKPGLEQGSGSGYFPGGKYFYATKIYGDAALLEQSIILEFEGVYQNSSVYLNGEKVGGWIYGYTNFFVDISEKICIGKENDLLVEVDNSKTPNSRWYTGSGIYRPVNIWTGKRSHIKPEGLHVKTVSINPAVIHISADIEASFSNDTHIKYIISYGDKEIAEAEGKETEITITDARLWSAQEPNLYKIKAVLKQGDIVMDEAEDSFGIRVLAWDAKNGFQVNGQNVKLQGGCIHHDHGILGACTYDKAEMRRIKKLKEFGFNAIRYSHCPAGKNLLEACDRLGMYVLDESFDQWRIPNTKYDYATCFDEEWQKDLTALISKDYNHPSVIMYCIGNEISDTGRSYGGALAKELYHFVKALDDTRPVTIATNVYLSLMSYLEGQKESGQEQNIGSIEVNELMTKVSEMKEALTPEKIEELVGGSFDAVDIAGYNYGHDLYLKSRTVKPERVILSSETYPAQMAQNWKWVRENDWCIGDFLWSAWDYLGETGVGLPVYGTKEAPFAKHYPCLTASCGSFDLNGSPEAAAYYEAVIWGAYKKPYIGVRPVDHSGEEYTLGRWRLTDAVDCWTWDGCEGNRAQIIVYSIGSEAELWQDGELIGRKLLEDYKAEFATVYQPGKLTVVSYDADGGRIEENTLETAGKKDCLKIIPEELYIQADMDEIIYVPISLTDECGRLKMTTDKEITVTVEGPARLLALGSSRPETEKLFDTNTCFSWHGKVLAVLKSSGETGIVRITAFAEGCKTVCAEIQAAG